jgi:hypothetical protein
MATKLLLPGTAVVSEPTLDLSLARYDLNVGIIRTQSVEVAARGRVPQQPAVVEAQDTDIIELEWDNDVREWVSVAQLREDYPELVRQRGTAEEALRIPTRRAIAGRARGEMGWVLKGLKLLRIDPVGEVATASVEAILAHFEDKLAPGPGLYRLTAGGGLDERITTPSALTGEAPYLVFIHGTASSTTGSFGQLVDTKEWQALCARYSNRMLGLQHRSLSQNPTQNTLEFVELLPPGSKLHLVSHSRGGLVAELLCLRPLNEQDLTPFGREGYRHEAEQLRQLSARLQEKNLHIERFVRVACPARGTILASGRLDRWLCIIVNLLGFIPGLKGNPLYDFVKATLLEIAKRRTRPDEVPGLAAQMPEAPLVHLLNRPGVATKADLAVIAGDIEAQDFLGKLKLLATDLFYREDHDLVVNTRSMYGGLSREQGAYFFFDHGAEVNHFNYFYNPRTRERLLSWLTRADGEPIDPAFRKITRGALSALTVGTARAPAEAPVVFLVPDVLGTHLQDMEGRVWLDYTALALGGLQRLAIERSQIQAEAIIAPAYQRLTDFLQSRYQVVPFPYDWRRSVHDAGAQLAQAVQAELDKHGRPIRFLAHGMGGLVVRALIAQAPETWKRVCARDGRLVMLGTPNHGSYALPGLLKGQEDLMRLLDLLDPQHTRAQLVCILRGYPGLQELLPDNALTEFPDGVKRAQELRARLALAVDRDYMVYVAGSAPAASVPSGSNGQASMEPETAHTGDGRVTYAQGRLPGVLTWYMPAAHGDLADYPPSFPALSELLDTGRTSQLSLEAPARASSLSTGARPQEETPLLFPTEEELVAAALGRSIEAPGGVELHMLKVSVSHGDLTASRYPVAVGHYEGDVLISAEKRLDEQLGHRLAERFHLYLYPERVGTAEVIRAEGCRPPGALIIGLGEVGALTPEKLRQGVTSAALRYALSEADSCRPDATEWQSAAFSALLLGTFGNALSIENSVTAIVQGVVHANRALRNQGLWNRVRIDAVELIELYEDITIEAMHAVARLVEHPPRDLSADEVIVAEPAYLRAVEGGRYYQRPANPYATGWWRRIQITGDGGRGLQYLVMTDRARAEETLQPTQCALIDQFVDRAARLSDYDESLAVTLFELLVPNPLKDQAREAANLVLVVDQAAAQYPWELLAERTRDGIQALALQQGVIRQFKTEEYRARPQPAREKNALVVGNPKTTRADLPSLPGAQREAAAVAGVLKAAGYEVVQTPDTANAITVISDLFAKDYRIVHLAGHGIYDPQDPGRSGMALESDMFLSTREIRQLRQVPELVFINCCYLGRINRELPALNRLAASLAEELIRMGVKAVVAAGWAVNDDAATTFAETFYRALLVDEQRFGEAVRNARNATWKQHGETNTWGAYQCYGNPDFALAGNPSAVSTQDRCYSQREYIGRLNDIIAEVRAAGANRTDRISALREQVQRLEETVPSHWRDGITLAAFGDTWSALGDFGRAIEAYREAISHPDSEGPFRALEQFANFQSRYAPGGPDALQRMHEATAALEWLLRLGETSERLAMLGGNYKRLALAASTDAERRAMLAKACEFYGRAHQHNDRAGILDPYPTLNWITYRVLLHDTDTEGMVELIRRCKQEAEKREKQTSSFWTRVHQPDAALLEHLIQEDLADAREGIIKEYHRVLATGTQREQDSAVSQLDFLAKMLADEKALAPLQEIRRALA